jgi:hypothetical protein
MLAADAGAAAPTSENGQVTGTAEIGSLSLVLVCVDGADVRLASTPQRVVLARLALAVGRLAPPTEPFWYGTPPGQGRAQPPSVQVQAATGGRRRPDHAAGADRLYRATPSRGGRRSLAEQAVKSSTTRANVARLEKILPPVRM